MVHWHILWQGQVRVPVRCQVEIGLGSWTNWLLILLEMRGRGEYALWKYVGVEGKALWRGSELFAVSLLLSLLSLVHLLMLSLGFWVHWLLELFTADHCSQENEK